MAKRDGELGAGPQSGCFEKSSLKGQEKKLSKPLNDETAKQGPRNTQPADGKFKFA